MKQFKKWKENNCIDNCDIGVDTGVCKRCTGLGTKEDVWKAALECVRDKMLPNCHEPMDIYDFIEEELNGKS